MIQSATHAGPLDPETSLIANLLYKCNKLDIITFDSQPYEMFTVDEIVTEQYPYVECFYWSNKIDSFVDNLIEELPESIIWTIRLSDNNVKRYGNNNEPIGSVDHLQNESISNKLFRSKDPLIFLEVLGEFSSSVVEDLRERCSIMVITDQNLNNKNKLFNIMVRIAHSLYD